jgi:hypothetical protein
MRRPPSWDGADTSASATPRGADRACSLGSAQAAVRALATVEDSTASPIRQHGWQWSRPLAPTLSP